MNTANFQVAKNVDVVLYHKIYRTRIPMATVQAIFEICFYYMRMTGKVLLSIRGIEEHVMY